MPSMANYTPATPGYFNGLAEMDLSLATRYSMFTHNGGTFFCLLGI